MKRRRIPPRSRRISIRLSPEEYQRVAAAHARSLHPTLTDLLRVLVLEQPVRYYTRNASFDDFIGEAIALRRELATLHKVQNWTTENQVQLLQHQENLKSLLTKIYDLCIRTSVQGGTSATL